MKRMFAPILAMTVLACQPAAVRAATDFPTKPISLVVPGPAGGAIDNVARVIAEAMAVNLGQSLLMVNADGAGGTLATSRVAHAKPDGYTVLFHHIGVATAPAIYANLPYDTRRDLIPIGLTTEVPMVLIARKDLPAGSLKELLPYLKQQGDKIMLATAGPGNVSDLCGTVLMWKLGDTFTRVAYRGSPPALLDMIGGRVDIMCDQTSTAAAQIKAGAVKAYGVAAPARLPVLADVPTLTEGGLPFEFSIWQGLYVPTGTPPEVITRLSAAVQYAVAQDSVKKRLEPYGATVVAPERALPQAHRAFLDGELKKWDEIFKSSPKTCASTENC